MKPNELNVSDVQLELESLIQKYPTRKGSVLIPSEAYFENDEPGDYDTSCVYYTDEENRPINTSNYAAHDLPVFKTPICIVGQWIEDFHPEFKEDELIQSFLVKNAIISSLFKEENPFNEDVKAILSTAQNMQDGSNAQWQDIVLG